MLLAMARDVRVILSSSPTACTTCARWTRSPRDKRARIARETLEIYAPIAHRLGLNQIYRELQELSFQHLQPWRYAALVEGGAEGARPPARPRRDGAAATSRSAFAAGQA